ncbi:hypothetical protein JL722_9167 [Aureococcus anophagefferens]|nr:hypothetical protein JL722_9167 [Aureococcus anophagefferens]
MEPIVILDDDDDVADEIHWPVPAGEEGQPRHDETEVFTYPCRGAPGWVQVRVKDVYHLNAGEYLTDNLINLYLMVLLTDPSWSRLKRREGFEGPRFTQLKSEVHAFSSYFLYWLLKNGGTRVDSAGQQAAYSQVERWTRPQHMDDVFSKKFLLFPFHDALHWSLAIVCHPGELERIVGERRAREAEGGVERGEATAGPSVVLARPRPCIIFMDSLNAHNGSALAKSLRVFLKYELEKRKTIVLDLKEEDLPLVQPAVLHQPNSVDCGLYVLRYAEEFLARAAGSAVTIDVTQTEVSDLFASHDFVNWFTQSEIDVMRAAHRCTIEVMGQHPTLAPPGIE